MDSRNFTIVSKDAVRALRRLHDRIGGDMASQATYGDCLQTIANRFEIPVNTLDAAFGECVEMEYGICRGLLSPPAKRV